VLNIFTHDEQNDDSFNSNAAAAELIGFKFIREINERQVYVTLNWKLKCG
jgi:hypothetical protein